MAYDIDMKVANIADLKNNLSRFISLVESGEEIEVRKRNIPVARVVPIQQTAKNKTVLGCGRDSAKIYGDLTEPLIPLEDWNMQVQNNENSS